MAEITAALVMELRAKSGVGMMDCKKALQETDGDINAAIDWLRAKGLSKAAKRAKSAPRSSSTRKRTSSPATSCSRTPPRPSP